MRIILRDEDEQMAFEIYAEKIGIPLSRWFDDMWVGAFCAINGCSPEQAICELRRRVDDHRSCCGFR